MIFKERRSDCTLIEKFIWDKIGLDYGEFTGIHSITEEDLLKLKVFIELELQQKYGINSSGKRETF